MDEMSDIRMRETDILIKKCLDSTRLDIIDGRYVFSVTCEMPCHKCPINRKCMKITGKNIGDLIS